MNRDTADIVLRQAWAIVLARMLDVFYETDNEALRSRGLFLMGMFFLIAGVAGVCQFLQPLVFGRAGERLTKRLRLEAFKSIVRQDMVFFDCPVRCCDSASCQFAVVD